VRAINEERAVHFPHLSQQFSEQVDGFGPTDYHTMHLLPFPFQQDIDSDVNPPFKTLIAILKYEERVHECCIHSFISRFKLLLFILLFIYLLFRLSNWDPEVFFRFIDVINEQISTCSKKLLNDFLRGIPQLTSN